MILSAMPIDKTNKDTKGARGMCLGQSGSTGIADAKVETGQETLVLI